MQPSRSSAARLLTLLILAALGCGNAAAAGPTPAAPEPTEEPPRPTVAIAAAPAEAPAEEATAAEEGEPGRAQGPCPTPSAEARQIWARALALAEKTTDPGPHRAMAEAVLLRLAQLYQHGCYRRLDAESLRANVAAIAADPKELASNLGVRSLGEMGIVASYGTGFEGWTGWYRWRKGKVRTLLVVTGEAGDMDQQLLVLGGDVFQPPGSPQPFLALANTHPWTASCWRALRFRILAPSGDPFAPRVLLDRSLSGRWCEGVAVQAKGDTVTFGYEGWGGPWSMALVQRPYALSFQYRAGAFEERFGFVPGLEHLAEDWLLRPWALAEEATAPEARSRLKALHERLNRQLTAPASSPGSGVLSEYTSELFPVSESERRLVLYCVVSDSKRPCPEWPQPVDVRLERSGLWRVKDVQPRK